MMMVTALVAIASCYVAVKMYPPTSEEAVAKTTVTELPQQLEKGPAQVAVGATGRKTW